MDLGPFLFFSIKILKKITLAIKKVVGYFLSGLTIRSSLSSYAKRDLSSLLRGNCISESRASAITITSTNKLMPITSFLLWRSRNGINSK